jgi:hypothetical protein
MCFAVLEHPLEDIEDQTKLQADAVYIVRFSGVCRSLGGAEGATLVDALDKLLCIGGGKLASHSDGNIIDDDFVLRCKTLASDHGDVSGIPHETSETLRRGWDSGSV